MVPAALIMFDYFLWLSRDDVSFQDRGGVQSVLLSTTIVYSLITSEMLCPEYVNDVCILVSCLLPYICCATHHSVSL